MCTGGSPGVAFETFQLFYTKLLQESHDVGESYSTIRYVFDDSVETTYRLGQLPVSTMPMERVHLNTYHSTEHPDWSVAVYREGPVVARPLELKTYVVDRRVEETELCIHWIFNTSNRQYHLIKSGAGRTKQDASAAVPTFTIRTILLDDSGLLEPVHDLFLGNTNVCGTGSNNLRMHPPKLNNTPKSLVSVDSPVIRLCVTPVPTSV